MNKELFINVADKKIKVFLQNGFFENCPYLTDYAHKHSYSEIHVMVSGSAVLTLNRREILVKAGDFFVIPPNTMHKFSDASKDVINIPFQIGIDTVFSIKNISEDIPKKFNYEINNAEITENYAVVQQYISLICSYLLNTAPLKLSEIIDYAFIIHEFFNLNYNKNVHISDLANELHLSEKQTERLVVKYTGNPFNKELKKRRMDIAGHLMNQGNLSLCEIAQYVGYRSYSGFWKAYKNTLQLSEKSADLRCAQAESNQHKAYKK